MNSVLTLRPYRHNSTWVFDDPAAGLVREPFVEGIPAMIDRMVEGIPGAARGFRLLFSATPFPGAIRLDWLREEIGGNWYRWNEGGMEGWLCPALFKYFDAAPSTIYVIAEPAEGEGAMSVTREEVQYLVDQLEAGRVSDVIATLRQLLGT